MKLKGKKAVTNKDIDCRPTGGPFIPIGSVCTIKIVRRSPGYKIGVDDPKNTHVWVDFIEFGQRHIYLEDLKLNDLRVRILATGEVAYAEIVELNCIKIGTQFYQHFEYEVLMDTEELKEEIRSVIAAQGWNDETVGILAGEFIAEKNLNDLFLEFLKEQAKEENEAITYAEDHREEFENRN